MKTQRKIKLNMTDKERYKVLKKRKLNLSVANTNVIESFMPETLEELKFAFSKQAKPILKKIAEEFGVFKDYYNENIELDFGFSRAGFYESIQKQGERFNDFAKMLSCFDGVIENAIGIEIHNNRYKPDPNVKNIYVLVGAFKDIGEITPVKLLIKELESGTKNVLHIAVAKNKIKESDVYRVPKSSILDITSPPSDSGRKTTFHTLTHANADSYALAVQFVSTISIRRLLKKINTSDGDFLKYIPKQFLGREQRRAAEDARAAEQLYIKNKLAERERRKLLRGKEELTNKRSPKEANASLIKAQTKPQKSKKPYCKKNNGK